MIRKLPLVAFAALAACAVPMGGVRVPPPAPLPVPEPVMPAPVVNPQSAKERFIRTAEANGCEVNAANSSVILAGATLSQEDLARILTELKAEGRGEIGADGQSFRVTTGTCA